MSTIRQARIDVDELTTRVQAMYRSVAQDPDSEFHFELGRQLADRLGYPAETLDQVPTGAVKSFAGVGYFFSLADLGEGDFLFGEVALRSGAARGYVRVDWYTADALPTWLEEGVATFMEGSRWDRDAPIFLPWANIERYDQLRRASAQGWLAPLDELLGASPPETLGRVDEAGVTYYAQVWALVHFLNEGANERYRAGLRELLADSAEGRVGAVLRARLGAGAPRDGRAVFAAYFNPDLDEAAEQYAVFVDTLAGAGARDAVAAGLSPFQTGAAPDR